MKVLVKKMKSLGILKLEMVVGAIIMLAVLILLPGSIAVQDASLLLNPFVLGTVLVGMVMFGSFAYFLFIRPYFLYRKSPEVLAETDGEYLYIHGKKEAKRPLADLSDCIVDYTLPFVIFHGFIGSTEQVKRAVERGYFLSFGHRTFRSPKSIEAMKNTPTELLFFETDECDMSIGQIYSQASATLGIPEAMLEYITNENFDKICG